MKKILLITFMFVTALVTQSWAQDSVISGKITSAEDGSALPGVNVILKGTTTGTTSDIDGNYKLNVPSNDAVLIFSFIGLSTQEITVGGKSVIDIAMSEDAKQLTEVVVTAQGIQKEKRALGYAVTTISNKSLEARVQPDVARMLNGHAPGVNITQTSGIAGSGTNIIIRGYSSISGSNQPLFVVDGVPFNTDTNSDNAFTGGGGTSSSRFLDLDPNNIEEVSILKGLSATVLYGEAGRNGVILVTTKTGNSGKKEKKMEVSLIQGVGFTQVANFPDYQDQFGGGFSGNFGWFFSNWGPSFDIRGSNGIADDGTVAHPYDQAQYNDDFPEFIGKRYQYKAYDNVKPFFQTGVSTNTSVSVSKSWENASIAGAYSFLSDEGFTPGNTLDKHNFSLGGSMKLQNGLKIHSTFNYVSNSIVKPPAATGQGSNPAGSSVFANLLYTPRSIDLTNLPFESPIDGSNVYYRRGSAIANPRWVLKNAHDYEIVDRFFGNIDLNYEIFKGFNAHYRYSLDQYTQQKRREINKGGPQTPGGQMITSDRINRTRDIVVDLSYQTRFNDDFDFDALVGVNMKRETRDLATVVSTQQFVFDVFTHDNFIEHRGSNFSQDSQGRLIGPQRENLIGVYATASLGYKSYAYLNVQARSDWTSTLENGNNNIIYPSASISFIPTDAIPALESNSYLNYLKLRLGYGTSAGYPDPYATRNVLGTGTNTFVTPGGEIVNVNSVSQVLGNKNLKPELHTELEFGLEGKFFNNILGIDFSMYNKTSDDLIVQLPLDPSTGYSATTINAAKVENKGVELGVTISPFKGKFRWNSTINFTRNRSKVIKIADGTDQVLIAGFSNLGNFAIPNRPYGVIQGLPFERSAAGELLVGADGNYVPGTDIAEIGDPNEDFTMDFINGFSYKGITLNAHISYKKGGDIYSVSTATLLARGLTEDTNVDRFLPIILPGVKSSDGTTPNDIQGYIGDYFFRSYFFADEGTIFDGTVIRLRQISLSYQLPKKLLERTPFGTAGITINGENLWYNAPNFPKHVNFDPEVLSLGVGNGRGFDYITGPTSKKYSVTLNLTF